MATTYAGVTIEPLAESDMWRPWWTQEANVTVRHIPHSNADDVQATGRGNFKIKLDALISDDSGVSTLQASVGATGRTLADLFGETYSNVRLIDVGEPRRWDFGTKWRVSLTFMRQGS